MVSCVINRLSNDSSLDENNVTLFGFSLGAEVAAFAGKNVKTVGLIIGLDPAGPGFTGFGAGNHLDYTDARFVATIHTSAYGIPSAIGNIDFYTNGGQLSKAVGIPQPGCAANENIPQNLTATDFGNFFNALINSCSHGRAPSYAVADLNYTDTNGCQLIGYECDSYDNFSKGKCGDCGSNNEFCKPMPLNIEYYSDLTNFNATKHYAQYYLKTGDVTTTHYCLYHYQITITFNGTPKCSEVVINLSDKQQITVELENESSAPLSEGSVTYTDLITQENELTPVNRAQVNSTDASCAPARVQINYMSSIDASIRQKKSLTLCGSGGQSLTSCD